MPRTKYCVECGAPLPQTLAGGLCAKCALNEVSGCADPLSGPSSLPSTGRRFGDYELLEEIAHGGMGVVFKARQLSLDRIVAVKMIRGERLAREADVSRFRQEAAAAARLHHPNIVAIHEAGEFEGQHYYSMDYIAGGSLAAIARERPLPARRAVGYVQTIAEAIHYAHTQGVLHRDLKPANVLLDAYDVPRIADFGLAKILQSDSGATLTGHVMGSPCYMSPEQAAGRMRTLDARTDVYALGAILYELVCGRPPFQAESSVETLKMVVETEAVSPRLLVPRLPRDLETICLKCLEKEPARRYTTAQLLAEELGRFLRGEPVLARPVRHLEKAWRWCRRQPVRAGLSAALMLVLVLGAAGVFWQWQRAKASELKARQNAYAADISLAQRALLEDDVGRALDLLNKHRPAPGVGSDLRGWEWRYLWQRCQGDELSVFHVYPEEVLGVAISRDNRYLAARVGQEVALWDLKTRTPLPGLTNATGRALAFSPVTNVLVFSSRLTGGQTGVELWNIDSRERVQFIPRDGSIRSIAFSPDGFLLAIYSTTSDTATVSLWSWPNNTLLRSIRLAPARRGAAGVVTFSSDGERLALGGDYGEIQVVQWRTGAIVKVHAQTEEGVAALAFSSDGQWLAASFAYTDTFIGLWDPVSGRSRGRLTNHTSWVSALAFEPQSQRLVSAGIDRTIRLWSVPDGKELRRLRGHRRSVSSMALLPDRRLMVSGGADGSIRFWDLMRTNWTEDYTALRISYGATPPGLGLGSFARGAADPRAVTRLGLEFTRDSEKFLTTDRNGALGLWQARPLRLAELLPSLGGDSWGLTISPDARWLAVGDAKGYVQVWDWLARRLIATREMPFSWCGTLQFSPGGRFLMAKVCFNDLTQLFRVWKMDGWQEVPLPELNVRAVWAGAISPDDRLLAVPNNAQVEIRDLSSGRRVGSFPAQKAGVHGLRFSPDGQMLACAYANGQIVLGNLSDRLKWEVLGSHWAGAWGLAFSPDGRRLASSGEDAKEAVKLWDLETRRELLNLRAEGQYFVKLDFSPDGRYLVAVSLDGVACLWEVPSMTEIESVEKGKGGL